MCIQARKCLITRAQVTMQGYEFVCVKMRAHTHSLKMNPWWIPEVSLFLCGRDQASLSLLDSSPTPISPVNNVTWSGCTCSDGPYTAAGWYIMWVCEEKTQYSIKMLLASVGRGNCSNTGQKSNNGKPLDWGWNLRIFPVLLCLQNKGSPNCSCSNFKHIYV